MVRERGEEPTTEDLVERRARLLTAVRSGDGAADAALADVTDQLRTALADAEPTVRRIEADDPDHLVRRLIRREPVHPLDDPDDRTALDAAVSDRTDRDRRLFAMAHPALPGRPMNVVWVALCRGVPGGIDALLDLSAPPLDPTTADTAVFWSIWNAEPGLAGLGRGRTLIEGAVQALRAELPALREFVTLSPVPTLRSWMQDRSPAPIADPPADELLRQGATYLTSLGPDGRPLDPVARFHLGNGARIWRLHADGDLSVRGRNRSFGLMVNYRYEPEDRAANRAALAGGIVAVSAEVDAVLG